MSEIKSVFVPVEASELLAKVRSMKADGYRLGQACATKCKDGHIEVLYSFDKYHSLTNLKVMVQEDMELQEKSGVHSFTKTKCTTCSVSHSRILNWTIRAISSGLHRKLLGTQKAKKGR